MQKFIALELSCRDQTKRMSDPIGHAFLLRYLAGPPQVPKGLPALQYIHGYMLRGTVYTLTIDGCLELIMFDTRIGLHTTLISIQILLV